MEKAIYLPLLKTEGLGYFPSLETNLRPRLTFQGSLPVNLMNKILFFSFAHIEEELDCFPAPVLDNNFCCIHSETSVCFHACSVSWC